MLLNKYKYRIANLTGIPSLLNFMNRKNPLILTYHGIFDGPDIIGHLPQTFVHVNQFVRQIKFIKKKYRLITPEDLSLFIEDNRHPLPDHSALITFDDGYESFNRLAFPVLKGNNIQPIVFVPTRYLEDHKPYWFDVAWLFLNRLPPVKTAWVDDVLRLEVIENKPEPARVDLILQKMKMLPSAKRDILVAEMISVLSKTLEEDDERLSLFQTITLEQAHKLSKSGVVFGGHTHSHTILTSMSLADVKAEVIMNKQKIESVTENPCDFFAYPNGGQRDFNNDHKRVLGDAGYKAAFSLTQKRSSIKDDLMDISRINVNPEDTLESLAFHCTGIVPYIQKVHG